MIMKVMLTDFIFLILSFIYGCNTPESSKMDVSAKTETPRTESIGSGSGTDINKISPEMLDSILYAHKFRLKEINKGRFSYEPEFIRGKEIIKIVSRSRVNGQDIEYTIEVRNKDSNLNINKFNFINEQSYEYLNSKIRIGRVSIDITNSHFVNDSSRVQPAGLWHGSIDSSALKYYRYNNRDYYLLNGANLYCNGTHCNSFQVYLLVKNKNNLKINSIYFQGLPPYEFENIHLVDIYKDGYPEIYIPKGDVAEIKGIKDFDIYTIDSSGELKRNAE